MARWTALALQLAAAACIDHSAPPRAPDAPGPAPQSREALQRQQLAARVEAAFLNAAIAAGDGRTTVTVRVAGDEGRTLRLSSSDCEGDAVDRLRTEADDAELRRGGFTRVECSGPSGKPYSRDLPDQPPIGATQKK